MSDIDAYLDAMSERGASDVEIMMVQFALEEAEIAKMKIMDKRVDMYDGEYWRGYRNAMLNMKYKLERGK